MHERTHENGKHERPIVRYDDLSDVAGQIELAPGEMHEVLSMGRESVALFEQSQATKDMKEQSGLLYDLAALALPDVPRERIDRLSLKRINVIVAMASEQIELVRELARATGVSKNVQPTETPTTTQESQAAQAPSGSTT